ncbi:MAG TPA: hypothetical protein VFK00_10440, partial [Rhodanobacteraceae bacterium]|nr:hypothetical protein [Rhodanobacteraceae bacterium]
MRFRGRDELAGDLCHWRFSLEAANSAGSVRRRRGGRLEGIQLMVSIAFASVRRARSHPPRMMVIAAVAVLTMLAGLADAHAGIGRGDRYAG